MPIQPPRSGISLLSPASLMRNRESRGNNFQSIMNQFINYGINRSLQDRSYEMAAARDQLNRENRLDDLVASGLTGGSILNESSAQTYVDSVLFPGEATNFVLPTITGPATEGETPTRYVPAALLQNSLQATLENRKLPGTADLITGGAMTRGQVGAYKDAGLDLDQITLATQDDLKTVQGIVANYEQNFAGTPETQLLKTEFSNILTQLEEGQPITQDELGTILSYGEPDKVNRVIERIQGRSDVAFDRRGEVNARTAEIIRDSRLRIDGEDFDIEPALAEAIATIESAAGQQGVTDPELREKALTAMAYMQDRPDPIAIEGMITASASSMATGGDPANHDMAVALNSMYKSLVEQVDNTNNPEASQAAQARLNNFYETLGITEATASSGTQPILLRTWLQTSDSYMLRLAQSAINQGYTSASDWHDNYVLEGNSTRAFGDGPDSAFQKAARLLLPSWGTTIGTRAASPTSPPASEAQIAAATEFINSPESYALTGGFQDKIPLQIDNLRSAGGVHDVVTDSLRVEYATNRLNQIRQGTGVGAGEDLPTGSDSDLQQEFIMLEMIKEIAEMEGSDEILKQFFSRLFPS